MSEYLFRKLRIFTIATTLAILVFVAYCSIYFWPIFILIIFSPISLIPFIINVIFSIRVQKNVSQIPLMLAILSYGLLFSYVLQTLPVIGKSVFVLWLLVPFSLIFMLPLWILSLRLDVLGRSKF
jgi:hypothetical protein